MMTTKANRRYYLFILSLIGVLFFWVFVEMMGEDIYIKKLDMVLDVYRSKKLSGKNTARKHKSIIKVQEESPQFDDYPKIAML